MRYVIGSFLAIASVLTVTAWDKQFGIHFQSTILDLRLATASSGGIQAYLDPKERQAQLKKRLQTIQSITDISYRYEIPVASDRLMVAQQLVQGALKQSESPAEMVREASIASLKLRGVEAMNAVAGNTVQYPASAQTYAINSMVDLSNKAIGFQGNHTRIAGSGTFLLDHSTVVFDGIDFVSEKPYGQSFFDIASTDSTVIVRSSTVENLQQPLDGITWVKVTFQHSRIEATGRPFVLVNAIFRDCDFSHLTIFSPGGSALLDTIQKANGGPVNFSFAGYTSSIIP